MNSIERELNSYINEAERFSGFDSYDSFDDEGASYFDNDEMSYAAGTPAAAAQSDPYIVQYQNTTASNVTAVLFGYNDYGTATNNGNPTDVVITNLQGGTYGRLLTQSNNKPFKVGKWRFQSTTASQLTQTLTINHVDANGKQYSIPFNLAQARDSYQQQSDILDATKVITVDGNTFITFTLVASATFVISMYPVVLLSGKAQLNDGSALNRATAPRLSGKNVAPVIIQTSQGVQGITKA